MTNHTSKADSLARTRKLRKFKDKLATHVVGFGGISVIIAICLIFLYLLYEVLPLFYPAEVSKRIEYILPGDNSKTLYMTIEDRMELTTRVSASGQIYVFNTFTGKIIHSERIKLPENTKITSFFKTEPARGFTDDDEKKLSKEITVFGLDNGSAIMLRHYYDVSHDQTGKRIIKPKVDYPFFDKPLVINQNQRINHITAEWNEDGITLATHDASNQLILTYLEKENSLDEDELTYTASQHTIAQLPVVNVKKLLINKTQSNLYILDNKSGLTFYNVIDKKQPKLIQYIPSLTAKSSVTDIKFLIGGISLLIASADGQIAQWFPVRDDKIADKEKNISLQKIREFSLGQAAVISLATEYRRKGFVAIDASGKLGVFHSTAHETLYNKTVSNKKLQNIYLSPRANAALISTENNSIQLWLLTNEHPEVSWSALWNKNWYESYPQAEYTWQSSSSTDDFEPKYSLIPLSFGTLKAAFYAMLISVPLAIMGAIFTAYFMAPRMRKLVKPGIEIMEALPTVIIGFLAGIWLAPLISQHLAGVFLIILTVPLGILLCSYIWHSLPAGYRYWLAEGWEPALLIPAIILITWLTFGFLGPALEYLFFNGSLVHWMETKENPITYDQRNAIVVGIAMGFAVIPTIFSIAEDAIFAVPKHLTQGSLALGATTWQTMSRVVLLTASPGIFSAVMIGFGRAIGETMIVLMATGNTPIMETSIFQGLRTLSANIAVELPESAQHSTHFRILFLAALVLFIFTFLFNTIAEIVRQRLRSKYSNL